MPATALIVVRAASVIMNDYSRWREASLGNRRAYIIAYLDKIGVDYEIVTGIDGRDLDLDDPSICLG